MMPKFASPAADYVERRLSIDEICISKPSATYFLRAAGQALVVGIHTDALLVVDSSATPVHGSIIVASGEGEHVLRRLRLYPYRALEFLDGSGRETELGNEDLKEGVQVFVVVMYCVNDMRSCEWDDLPVI
ncbi:S24 family peptidase [Serratia sarumanii]|uniref:HumD family translesion DNA polymerase n=1 Tax=Serratia sarumanii TaxID=3020826 RepID=UPI003D7DBFDF